MSDIFNTETIITREEQIKLLVAKIYQNNLIARDALIYAIQVAMDTIWKHPEFSPQEFLDVIGTNGYALFKAAVIFQQALAATVPEYKVKSIEEEYAVNPDGSVTHIVNESSESSESSGIPLSDSSESSAENLN